MKSINIAEAFAGLHYLILREMPNQEKGLEVFLKLRDFEEALAEICNNDSLLDRRTAIQNFKDDCKVMNAKNN